MKNALKITSLLSCVVAVLLAAPVLTPVLAQDPGGLKNSGILDQLVKQTGVYDRSKSGKTPDFVADPTWPRPLPHSWLLGRLAGFTSTATTMSGSTTGRAR
jgi:hypothetical protein